MNYLVWSRGSKGEPTAAIQMLDPRRISTWKQDEERTIQIVDLVEPYSSMSLDSLIVMFPCPEFQP